MTAPSTRAQRCLASGHLRQPACRALPRPSRTRPVPAPRPAGEATLGKGDLEAKGESLYVANYAY